MRQEKPAGVSRRVGIFQKVAAVQDGNSQKLIENSGVLIHAADGVQDVVFKRFGRRELASFGIEIIVGFQIFVCFQRRTNSMLLFFPLLTHFTVMGGTSMAAPRPVCGPLRHLPGPSGTGKNELAKKKPRR